MDPDAEFFAPLQKLLDQCRATKVLTRLVISPVTRHRNKLTRYPRKLAKRLEDLIQDSGAVKALLVPRLKSLSENVPELVNFGFSLAQQVMPHLSEVRSTKSTFKIAAVLDFVKQCATSTVGKNRREGPVRW